MLQYVHYECSHEGNCGEGDGGMGEGGNGNGSKGKGGKGKGGKGGKGSKGKRGRESADMGQGHKKEQGGGQQPGGAQGTEGGGNEGMGEGQPKTVDIVAMPADIAIATTTHGRKTMPAHKGGGSSLPPLHCNHDNNSRSNIFGSNRMMSASTPPQRPSRDKRTPSRGGGGDGRRINVIITVSHGSIQAANGDAEPPAYHHGLQPLDLFCAFDTFSLAIEQLVL